MSLLILILICIGSVRTQFHPLYDVLLKAIPDASNVRNIPITRISEVQTHYDSVLNCTSESVISKIIENVESVGNKTCNGFVFSNEEYLYYAVRSAQTIRLKINELTVVSAAMNVEGVCGGDYLFSVQIYKADDQNGCTDLGLASQTAIFYPLEIYGNCRTTCKLGESTAKFEPRIFS